MTSSMMSMSLLAAQRSRVAGAINWPVEPAFMEWEQAFHGMDVWRSRR
jgi:hypothetical protein